MPQEAPQVNGVMELTEAETNSIRTKLIAIRDAFTPTDEQPVADTFYITATYNKTNEPKINGDTCSAVLAGE